MDVLRHEDHFLDDFLFVEKLRERVLKLFVELLEFLEIFFLRGGLGGLLPARVFFVHLLVEVADLLTRLAQRLQMTVAALDFFVDDDAVKATFLRRARKSNFSASAMCSFAAKPKL